MITIFEGLSALSPFKREKILAAAKKYLIKLNQYLHSISMLQSLN